MGAAKNEAQDKKDNRRGRASGGQRTSGGGFTHRFVRIELTADRKAEFKSLLAAGEYSDLTVDSLLLKGYSLKFSTGDEGATVICSLICTNEDDPNHQQILTGRGSSAAVALAVVAYKDVYCCDDGVWATGEPNGSGQGGDIG